MVIRLFWYPTEYKVPWWLPLPPGQPSYWVIVIGPSKGHVNQFKNPFVLYWNTGYHIAVRKLLSIITSWIHNWLITFITITWNYRIFCEILVLGPVGCDCIIHRLHLCGGVRFLNDCLRYDTKQLDGEVPVMLQFWGMWSTPLFPSLLRPLWPGVVAPNRVLSMAQIEKSCVHMLNWIAGNSTVFTFNCV